MAPKSKFEKKVSRGLIDPNTGKPTAKGVKRENTKKAIGNVIKGAVGSAIAGVATSKLSRINSPRVSSGKVSSSPPYKGQLPSKAPRMVGGIEQYYNEETGKYDRPASVVKTERHVTRRGNSKSGK
jgi:hypothetical protein